ncbi:carbohydrate binding domain-containing protein [Formosa sp. PL04]|uniref:carbohydrate binding domain-containing protein n=1 Tax=Formosa sp. PL04 TaxID=3081755 RepID=UPI00298126FF|nr:carbohydrate binding domain-containing protein [Formosa sp. PL04]MDW5287213.1 carbohydrate binding domain-containing protein [Formosa sp. PL04]
MKTIKILSLLLLVATIWSCSDDDADNIQLTEPTFTITVSPDDSSVYYFKNTTPNKEEFYNYWEFEVAGKKVADLDSVVVYQYDTAGSKIVTLTMVSNSTAMQSFEYINVELPIVEDDNYPTNPENLLLNGYLVEGKDNDFTYWGKYNGEDRITATDDALIGSRAMKVSNDADGNPWDVQFVSDAIETAIDQVYTVSFWGKGSGQIVRFSTKPDETAKYGPDFTLTSEWVQYSWTFTANEPSTSISLDMGTSTGTFVIDVIEVIPGSSALPLPSNDSLILNGGLEEGDGNDFTYWGKFNGEDRITAETTDVLDGSRAMKVSNDADGNPWDAQFVSDAATTEVDATYIASFWAKGTGQVRFSTKPDESAKYGPDFTFTSEWVQYSWEFIANEPSTNLSLDMGAVMGTFVIDNIKLEKK